MDPMGVAAKPSGMNVIRRRTHLNYYYGTRPWQDSQLCGMRNIGRLKDGLVASARPIPVEAVTTYLRSSPTMLSRQVSQNVLEESYAWGEEILATL